LPLHTQHLFITPEEIKATNDKILTQEQAQKKTQKAVCASAICNSSNNHLK
jgi:hypothetical protein